MEKKGGAEMKSLLLLVLPGLIGLYLLPSANTCTADDIKHRTVQGTAYRDGSPLGNYTIQASSNGGSNWSDVATTNGSGIYTWSPDANWPDLSQIHMQVKPDCLNRDDAANPTDQPYWWHTKQNSDVITVNVNGTACP